MKSADNNPYAVSLAGKNSALDVGKFKTITKIAPAGSLQARKHSNGAISFFWRYSLGTLSERILIGTFDSQAPPKSLTRSPKGFSVAAAVRAAEDLAQEHHANKSFGGRPALEAAKKAEIISREAEAVRAAKNSLKMMLDSYSDYLESLGRSSHRETRALFIKHVYEPWPELAKIPASQLSTEQFTDIIRKIGESGKGRTANKVRSYIRAAYQVALGSRSKASIPKHFTDFEVLSNPAAATTADQTQNRADKNPLSVPEMRLYWRNIKDLGGFPGAVLRLHLLTGGQRIEQFVRLKTVDCQTKSIKLLDLKGRPGKGPREHIIPLLPAATRSLAECGPKGEYALSTTDGNTHIAGTTLSKWAKAHSKGIKNFSAKRIRSGVETALASEGVSREDRGHLQSHGVSGVQSIHYDAYDYLKEKLKALNTLYSVLAQQKGSGLNV